MKWLLRTLFKILFWLLLLSVAWVLLYKWVPVKITPLMVIRAVEQQSEGGGILWKHDWETLEHISKNLQIAVICSEDQKFLTHNGFDLKAIEKAYKNNVENKRLRGGSTISQQAAKNVFLWPARSWVRKGLETWFTFLVELLWSKERILEVYLNSIEMGKGVYGAQAASEFWFGKPAAKLNKNEAAAIAAILPNPRNYKAKPPSAYIQSRIVWITGQMRYFGDLQFK